MSFVRRWANTFGVKARNCPAVRPIAFIFFGNHRPGIVLLSCTVLTFACPASAGNRAGPAEPLDVSVDGTIDPLPSFSISARRRLRAGTLGCMAKRPAGLARLRTSPGHGRGCSAAVVTLGRKTAFRHRNCCLQCHREWNRAVRRDSSGAFAICL